jgi:hypothetical protein
MKVQVTLCGGTYQLSFPKLAEYEPEEIEDAMKNVDIKNFNGMVSELKAWGEEHANGCRMVLFSGIKPTSLEERLLAETGKTFYMASTQDDIIKTDPYPQKRLITSAIFKRFLESDGVEPERLEEQIQTYLKKKYEDGTFSEIWTPIIFQEYVIGYIHVWINDPEKAQLGVKCIDELRQFAHILAFSLKINGYFESQKAPAPPFSGNVIDVSCSGLLFARPASEVDPSIDTKAELKVKILTRKKELEELAIIVRRFKDDNVIYFGCHFENMADEDLHFLFEYIYGIPFNSTKAKSFEFFTGKV